MADNKLNLPRISSAESTQRAIDNIKTHINNYQSIVDADSPNRAVVGNIGDVHITDGGDERTYVQTAWVKETDDGKDTGWINAYTYISSSGIPLTTTKTNVRAVVSPTSYLFNTPLQLTAGVVSLNYTATNFTLTTGSLDTIQNINTSATPQFAGVVTAYVRPTSDSTTAFSVRKADGVTHVVTFDTSNTRLGIGTTPSYELDVNGDCNVASGKKYKINGSDLTHTDVGAQALNSNLTSVSGLTYASTSFVKMTGANTFALDTNTYITSLSGAVLTDQTTPQTVGTTGNRLAMLWVTDITCTNAITGSVTGNAGTVTNATFTTALTVNTGTLTLKGDVLNTSELTVGAGAVSVSGANTGDQSSSDFDHNSLQNTHNLTTDIDHNSITNAHNLTTDIDHNSITNTHNLTTDIDHNSITNTHNLTTDIDHDSLTNTHNLSTDIDHDGLTNTHNLTTDIDHNSISGLDGGTAGEYYHLTSTEHTSATTVATISAIGLCPVLSNNAGQFLDGTGNFSAPAGGGDVLAPATNTDNYVPQWNGNNSKTLKDGLAVGTGASNLVQLDGSAKLPAIDGSALTNISTGTDSISAYAGGGQADATQINKGGTITFARVTTVATAGDSVKLFATFAIGDTVVVLNDTANRLDLYPSSGDYIDNLSADSACQVLPYRRIILTATTANANWRIVGGI